MMKILCAIALAIASTATASVQAAPDPVATFATWHMADLQDVTQAWYFTGAALSGEDRDGAPWAGDRPLVRLADAALAPKSLAVPALPAVPATVDVPPTVPEPGMASMLLLGLLVIFLRIRRAEDLFG